MTERLDVREYVRLLATSAAAAEEAILCEPSGPRGRWTVSEATRLVQVLPLKTDVTKLDPAEPVSQFIRLAAETIPKEKPHVPGQLWTDLMNGWPMNVYPRTLVKSCAPRITKQAKILEVGAGVGNASRLISTKVGDGYTRTDLHPELPDRLPMKGKVYRQDLDKPPPARVASRGPYDLIFGVNVLHCVTDRRKALAELFDLLKPGGRLVIAEGAPEVNGYPWALHWCFGLMDGWWDVGGFEPRWYWEQVGPVEKMRAVEITLGGGVYSWDRK